MENVNQNPIHPMPIISTKPDLPSCKPPKDDCEITDINGYNRSMSCSLIDKIFFMDKIDTNIDTIVDYGCADGSLVRFLSNIFPDITYCGYDNNSDMIQIAESQNRNGSGIKFCKQLNELRDYLNNYHHPTKTAILLSSVIHEVYSYSKEEDIDKFWKFITAESHFKYIIIRDMCLDDSAHRPSLKEDVFKIKSRYDRAMLDEFERVSGSITDNYNLIHFLMKYRYKDNWKREVNENYLPLSIEQISRHIDGYSLIYYDHYILPYLQHVVQRDFGITLKDYTHVKMIFKANSDFADYNKDAQEFCLS